MRPHVVVAELQAHKQCGILFFEATDHFSRCLNVLPLKDSIWLLFMSPDRRARGGSNDDPNLQLLCCHCNPVKGDNTMAEARVRSIELGVLKDQVTNFIVILGSPYLYRP